MSIVEIAQQLTLGQGLAMAFAFGAVVAVGLVWAWVLGVDCGRRQAPPARRRNATHDR